MKLPDPNKVVDGIGDSVLTIVEILPRTGQNVARVLDNYATQADSHIREVKDKLPEEPAIVAQTVFGAIGETIGGVIGVVEGVIKAGVDTVTEVKGNIDRSLQSS
jgi:hypothetical protein